MIPTRWRDVLALVVTGLVLAASAAAWLTHQPDLGFTIIESGSSYTVGSVTPGTAADAEGIRPGAAVISLDGQPVADWVRNFTVQGLADPLHTGLSGANIVEVETPGGPVVVYVRHQGYTFEGSVVLYLLGFLVLVGGAWWMKGGRAGAGLGGIAIPLACASAVPLLAAPLTTLGEPLGRATAEAGVALATTAPALASLLLADAISVLIGQRRWRIGAIGVAIAGAAAAALIPLLLPRTGFQGDALAVAWWALLLVTLVPMLIVTSRKPLPGTPLAGTDMPSAAWLLAAACAPALAMLTQTASDRDWAAWLVVPFCIALLVVGRAAERRIAQSRLQRDLVVTVTESERARLAAELHDVALQELTLLVRRLDANGDGTSAAQARTVSEHLRDLCGELHLPILDELGAGPALEWLVQQVSTATGEEVRLVRADDARSPAGVELAVFRVAQEAISNAVKHGGPPIVVHYTTSSSAASLFVDDAGPGLDADRLPIALRPGHYGLATMQQRAEQIGASLSIRSRPGGGTRVSLEWKES